MWLAGFLDLACLHTPGHWPTESPEATLPIWVLGLPSPSPTCAEPRVGCQAREPHWLMGSPGLFQASGVGAGLAWAPGEHLPLPGPPAPFLPVPLRPQGTARAQEARPELRQEQGRGVKPQNPLGGSPLQVPRPPGVEGDRGSGLRGQLSSVQSIWSKTSMVGRRGRKL